MANFSATSAAVLFCFFALSHALTPLNTPENEAVTLLLPDAADPTTTSNTVNADDNPLPLSTAVPFDRWSSKFPCHHRHKKYKSDPAGPLERYYGNDMLVSSGENSDFQDPESLQGGSWHRVKLPHHRHQRDEEDSDSDSDSDDEEDRIKKMVLKRRPFGGHDAEKKLKRHFHHENTEHHHKKHRGHGFMNRVRKFFEHYF